MNGISFIKKPVKLPKTLIYNYQYKDIPRYTLSRMFEVKSSNILANMVTSPKNAIAPSIPEEFWGKSLYIVDLRVNERNEGIGTRLLNYAKFLSKRNGCEGRMHLISSDVYDPVNPPHVFYRKRGFTSNDKHKIQQIDRQILEDKSERFDFHDMLMYYNPKSKIGENELENIPQKDPALSEKLREFVRSFFNFLQQP